MGVCAALGMIWFSATRRAGCSLRVFVIRWHVHPVPAKSPAPSDPLMEHPSAAMLVYVGSKHIMPQRRGGARSRTTEARWHTKRLSASDHDGARSTNPGREHGRDEFQSWGSENEMACEKTLNGSRLKCSTLQLRAARASRLCDRSAIIATLVRFASLMPGRTRARPGVQLHWGP